MEHNYMSKIKYKATLPYSRMNHDVQRRNSFVLCLFHSSCSTTLPESSADSLYQWVSHCPLGCTAGQLTALPPLHHCFLRWPFPPPLALQSPWTPLQLPGTVAHTGVLFTAPLTFCSQAANRKRRVVLLSSAAMESERRWGWRVAFMCGRCCGTQSTGGVTLSWVFPGRTVLYRRQGTMCWWAETPSPGAGNSKPISCGIVDRVWDFTQKRGGGVPLRLPKNLSHSLHLTWWLTQSWQRNLSPSLSASCWFWMQMRGLWDSLLMAVFLV